MVIVPSNPGSSVGTGLVQVVQNSSGPLASGELAVCDVTQGSFTLTLPGAPAEGDRLAAYVRTAGSAAGEKVSLSAVGSIAGSSADLELFLPGDTVLLEADDQGDWLLRVDGIGAHVAGMVQNTQQALLNATTTTINWDQVEFDSGRLAETANNRFVVQRGGVYELAWAFQLDSGIPADAKIKIDIFVDTLFQRAHSIWNPTADTLPTNSGMRTLILSSGDIVELTALQNSGFTQHSSVSFGANPRCSLREVRP